MSNFNPVRTGFKPRQQMAAEYGIDVRTLISNLRKRNIELPSGNLTPKMQKQVYEALGYPPGIDKKYYEEV